MALTLRATQPAPACSEHELVAAVRRGDDGAFSELYSRYQTRIGSYVFGMVGDHGRAEDIAQDVFISALRRMRENGRPIAFKPWIYEIAKNACIDEFRRTRRAREVPLEHDEGSESPSLVLASGQTPDVAVESKQRLEDLRGAFHGLSESHHKIIVMRELEGLSYSEIAERMGMSRPMVESTLFRARRRLSEEYEELVSGRRCEHVRTVIDRCDARAVRSLGVRERRQVARHLAHCQPCRRHARLAGFDDSKLHRGRAGKLAALLPLPWLRARRGGAGGEDEAFADTATSISHRLIALPSLQTLAAKIADPGSAAPAGLGRAAATAAAVMLAGVGGGIAGRIAAHATAASSSGGAAHVRPAPSGGPGGASGSVTVTRFTGIAGGSVRPRAAGQPVPGRATSGKRALGADGHDTSNPPAGSTAGLPTPGINPPSTGVSAPSTPSVSPPIGLPSTPPVSAPSAPPVSAPSAPPVTAPPAPSAPGVPSNPGLPSVPRPPSIPAPPNLPAPPGAPQLPNIPGVPSGSTSAPSSPQLPPVPSVNPSSAGSGVGSAVKGLLSH